MGEVEEEDNTTKILDNIRAIYRETNCAADHLESMIAENTQSVICLITANIFTASNIAPGECGHEHYILNYMDQHLNLEQLEITLAPPGTSHNL